MAKFLDPATLNEHMLANSYIEGAQPSQADISVFKATCPVPTLPHAARWYAHIKSFSEAKVASLPGTFTSLVGAAPKGGAAAAPKAAPAAAAEAKPKAEKKGKPSPEEIERLKAEAAAKKAAGGGKKDKGKAEAPKKEEKKEAAPAKSDAPVDAAEAAKKAEKHMLKIIKEGGKKGVEIEGASDMGGLDFFCTTMELPDGDLDQLEMSMIAMNAEPDPEAEDRKGCSGHIGKMIYSAGADQLALVAYVPSDEFNKSASKVDVTAWMDHVLGAIGGEVTKKAVKVTSLIPNKQTGDIRTGTTGKITGKLVVAKAMKDADKGKFPLKDKDSAMAAAFAFLRSKGAFPEDNDSDSDDMIFGDDDNLDDYA